MTTKLQDLRIAHEKEIYDKWAHNMNLDELLVKESFESPTAIENRYALSQLGPRMVEVASALAQKHKVQVGGGSACHDWNHRRIHCEDLRRS